MESNKRKKKTMILPAYFKKIGLAVIVLSIVPGAITKAMGVHHTQAQKDIWFTFSLNGFLLGLLFIAVSRDKVEDEMTLSIRLRAMAFAFVWVVLFVIIKPFIDLLSDSQIAVLTAQDAVGSMLFGYLIMYYLQKLDR